MFRVILSPFSMRRSVVPWDDTYIQRSRQVFDAVAVREDLIHHRPGQVADLRVGRDARTYGSLLLEAYR
jgi:hypothetical protein